MKNKKKRKEKKRKEKKRKEKERKKIREKIRREIGKEMQGSRDNMRHKLIVIGAVRVESEWSC